ncbi:hypothetical protein FG386_000614 [Cryptosporidium ryanae]|uniref:uncharacterized protein n=1 Tax=Cryptosporidium ryanae TaxID=515981 RepID=UPI00351A939A|nr:hypothetical protein FG386_000614 [Cryptosporidium ryanae]
MLGSTPKERLSRCNGSNEIKSHRRSKTFPAIHPHIHNDGSNLNNTESSEILNNRNKTVITSNSAFKRSFSYLLILAIIGIITVDLFFKHFRAITIFDRVVNNKANTDINDDKQGWVFNFEYLEKTFEQLNENKDRNRKSISLKQQKDGIGVVSNIVIIKNTVISDLDWKYVLYTRDDDKDSLSKRIAIDIEKGIISDIVGLMVLLIKHKRMLIESPLYPIFKILPSVKWFKKNGIFSMNKNDFQVASFGTTMEGIYDIIEKHCKLATSYIYSTIIKRELGISQEVDYLNEAPITQYDIQWSYMIVRSYSIEIGNGLAFIPYLLFMRRTNGNSCATFSFYFNNKDTDNSSGNNTELLHLEEKNRVSESSTDKFGIKLLSNKNIHRGDEIFLEDNKSSTDSEIFIIRGQWLTKSHKMILPIIFPSNIFNGHDKNKSNFGVDMDNSGSNNTLSNTNTYEYSFNSSGIILNDKVINIILKKFNCSLNIVHNYYFEENNAVNFNFIFCLKLISYIKYHYDSGNSIIVNIDPYSILRPLERKIEIDAASVGISIIQSKIDKLRSSAINIINHFGDKSVHQLPVIKVREAEMILLRNIIKYLHYWYYIVNDIDTYESYYYNLLSLN